MGKRGGTLDRPAEEVEVDLFDRAPTNKRSPVTGGRGSSSISVTGNLNLPDGEQGSKADTGSETEVVLDNFDQGGAISLCRGEKRDVSNGSPIGGRFWVLEQYDDEDGNEDIPEEVQRSPYLATFAEAFSAPREEKLGKLEMRRIGRSKMTENQH